MQKMNWSFRSARSRRMNRCYHWVSGFSNHSTCHRASQPKRMIHRYACVHVCMAFVIPTLDQINLNELSMHTFLPILAEERFILCTHHPHFILIHIKIKTKIFRTAPSWCAGGRALRCACVREFEGNRSK